MEFSCKRRKFSSSRNNENLFFILQRSLLCLILDHFCFLNWEGVSVSLDMHASNIKYLVTINCYLLKIIRSMRRKPDLLEQSLVFGFKNFNKLKFL